MEDALSDHQELPGETDTDSVSPTQLHATYTNEETQTVEDSTTKHDDDNPSEEPRPTNDRIDEPPSNESDRHNTQTERSGSHSEDKPPGENQDTLRAELLTAIENGSVDEVQKLLKADGANSIVFGYDFHSPYTDEGVTPLMIAAAHGHGQIAELLLEAGADLDAETLNVWWTALHYAAQYDRATSAKLLLEQGASKDAVNYYGRTPLSIAAQEGHLAVTKLLLDYGSSVDKPDDNRMPPLHHAVANGHYEAVELLLRYDANIQRDDYEGRNALHHACDQESSRFTRLLLENGADKPDILNEPNVYGRTPLHNAITNGHYKTAELLLNYHADIQRDDDYGRNALHHACDQESSRFTKLLLGNGADKADVLNKSDNHGCTPLQYAICGKGESNVDLLLAQKNIDLKHRDHDDDTALSETALQEDYGAMMKILSHETYMPKNPVLSRAFRAKDFEAKRISEMITKRLKENENNLSSNMKAILFWAVVNGDLDLMVDCIDRSKSLISWKPYNATWIHMAAKYGHSDLIEKLIGQNLSVGDVADGGMTVLHFAVESGNLPAVQTVSYQSLNSRVSSENDTQPVSFEMRALYLMYMFIQVNDQKEKESPFSLAVRGKRKHIEDFIWETLAIIVRLVRGAKPSFWTSHEHAQDAQRLLAVAAQLDRPGQEDNLKYLLTTMFEHGDNAPEESATALQWAVYHLQPVPVWWLLSNGGHLRTKEIKEAIAILKKRDTESKAKDIIDQLLHNPPPVIDHSANPFDDDPVEWQSVAPEGVDTLDLYGTIFDFYRIEDKRGQIDFQYKQERIENIIYSQGPGVVMSQAREGDYRDLSVLESAMRGDHCKSEPGSSGQADAQSVRNQDASPFGKDRKGPNLAFRWIHVPANDMNLLKDLVTRLSSDMQKTNKQHRPLASFLNRSWTKMDAGGNTKFMKPQCLRDIEKYNSAKTAPPQNRDTKPKLEEKRDHGDSKTEKNQHSNEPRENDKPTPYPDANISVADKKKSNPVKKPTEDTKTDAQLPGSMALYMPFLAIWDNPPKPNPDTQPSTKNHADGVPRETKDEMRKSSEFIGPKEEPISEFLKQSFVRGWNREIVHSRMTLDQFYYATVSDTSKRDEDQVLSRYLNEQKKKKKKMKDVKNHEDGGPVKENKKETILAVDQLWLWVIDEKTIITATTESSQGIDDIVFEDVVDSLVIGERDGAFRRPTSVSEMMELIIGAATGLFVKQHNFLSDVNGLGRKGVLDVFDESIRDVADREMKLFDRFRKSLERAEEGKRPNLKGQIKDEASNSSETMTPNDNGHEPPEEAETNSISKETELLREIKDICDELNILKTLVEAQETVWKQAFGVEKLENGRFEYNHSCTPATIRAELEETLHNAQDVLKSIYTLLDLRQKQASLKEAEFGREQSVATAQQSEETMKQSKTVMVFTVVTIVFLPLSFLTSLFALNVSDFPHRGDNVEYQGWWIFPIIFGTSAALSIPCVLLAFKVNSIEYFWNNPEKFKTLIKETTNVIKPRLASTTARVSRKSLGDEEKGTQSSDSVLKGSHSS